MWREEAGGGKANSQNKIGNQSTEAKKEGTATLTLPRIERYTSHFCKVRIKDGTRKKPTCIYICIKKTHWGMKGREIRSERKPKVES